MVDLEAALRLATEIGVQKAQIKRLEEQVQFLGDALKQTLDILKDMKALIPDPEDREEDEFEVCDISDVPFIEYASEWLWKLGEEQRIGSSLQSMLYGLATALETPVGEDDE